MKIKLLSCVLILLLALPLMAAPRKNGSRTAEPSALQVDNTTYINANNILMFVTNHGNFGRDLADVFGHDYGTYFPYTSVAAIDNGSNITSPNYASGLWVGGTDQATGDTLIIIAEYSDEYVPGPMAGGTFQPDVPEFRTYKLFSDSLGHPNSDYNFPNDTLYYPNQDWLDYMQYAVPAGADTPWVYDSVFLADSVTLDYIDTVPKVLGDQFLWSVFNDADVNQHSNDAGDTDPMGIEVRQSVFAYNREDPLGNCIFFRLQVFNKGAKTIENCYMSLWADPDLGGAGDDLVGCDTTLGIGYVYNATNKDQQYLNRPPCLGFDFFQGPMIGSPGDTAKMWGKLWPDSANLGMVSFNKYINGTDPDSYRETYGFMNGLTKAGGPYIYNGDTLLFVHTGDPVTGTGDLDISPADRRWMQSTGPITFAPGDSTEILAAIIVGLGGDRLSSISVMKYYDQFAQTAYDIDFDLPEPPARPIVSTAEFSGEVTLTWTDISERDPGDYPFQGYSVYQGETSAGPWTLIANYDVVDGIAQIQDDVLDPFTGALERRLVKQGTDSGIKRYFVVNQDYLIGGPLRNLTEYYFRVEAYSYDPTATPVTLTSANQTPIELTPQDQPLDVELPIGVGSEFTVEHPAGVSNGIITVEVVDPLLLTGDSYMVTFADTVGIVIDTIPGDPDTTYVSTDVAWFLLNTTTGDTILKWQTNQTGDDDYQVTNGMVVRVAGPSPGIQSIQEVATAGGPLATPDNVAYSLNSTGDWYISSDQANNFARLNWQGNMSIYDWEIRFTGTGQEYYDWASDTLFLANAPFEFWNIGIGTPNDAGDDQQINFSILDDDASGGWSWGDRMYSWEVPYVSPAPAVPPYVFPDDFRIGRIVINDASGALTAPETGTIIRFTTAKPNAPSDTFTFVTEAVTAAAKNEAALDKITAVPNPFYLYSSYDPNPGSKELKFHHLPEKCTITIYNLGGTLVRTIEKDDASTSIASWNLLTERGLPVASGIYIYVVDAPGFGQKVGKMAILVESEVLQLY